MKHRNFDQVKQTYLDHAEDDRVIHKLSPSHIISLKKVEIEERKVQLSQDALKLAVLGRLLGGHEIVEGEVVVDEPKQGIGDGSKEE